MPQVELEIGLQVDHLGEPWSHSNNSLHQMMLRNRGLALPQIMPTMTAYSMEAYNSRVPT